MVSLGLSRVDRYSDRDDMSWDGSHQFREALRRHLTGTLRHYKTEEVGTELGG